MDNCSRKVFNKLISRYQVNLFHIFYYKLFYLIFIIDSVRYKVKAIGNKTRYFFVSHHRHSIDRICNLWVTIPATVHASVFSSNTLVQYVGNGGQVWRLIQQDTIITVHCGWCLGRRDENPLENNDLAQVQGRWRNCSLPPALSRKSSIILLIALPVRERNPFRDILPDAALRKRICVLYAALKGKTRGGLPLAL